MCDRLDSLLQLPAATYQEGLEEGNYIVSLMPRDVLASRIAPVPQSPLIPGPGRPIALNDGPNRGWQSPCNEIGVGWDAGGPAVILPACRCFSFTIPGAALQRGDSLTGPIWAGQVRRSSFLYPLVFSKRFLTGWIDVEDRRACLDALERPVFILLLLECLTGDFAGHCPR